MDSYKCFQRVCHRLLLHVCTTPAATDVKLLFDISTKVISLDCFSYCVLQIISPQSEGKKIVVCLSSVVSKNLVTMFISAESLVGLEDVVCYLVSKTAHRLRSIQNGNPQSPTFIGPQTSWLFVILLHRAYRMYWFLLNSVLSNSKYVVLLHE